MDNARPPIMEMVETIVKKIYWVNQNKESVNLDLPKKVGKNALSIYEKKTTKTLIKTEPLHKSRKKPSMERKNTCHSSHKTLTAMSSLKNCIEYYAYKAVYEFGCF